MDFEGKTVLVTGAATGIGRATATAFVNQGAIVAANHIGQQDHIDDLAHTLSNAPGTVIAFEADVTRSDEVTSMVESIMRTAGRIDVLVNNAGVSLVKPFLETSESDWERIINTDLKSVYLCCRAVLPHMLAQGGGVVINIASELAFLGRACFSAYTAAKGGVVSLTRSLAREFAPTVRVNGVAPGPTWTPLLEKELAVPGHDEDIADIPLRRYAQPEEIAQSVLFLASDDASYYCGDFISPSGGTLMR